MYHVPWIPIQFFSISLGLFKPIQVFIKHLLWAWPFWHRASSCSWGPFNLVGDLRNERSHVSESLFQWPVWTYSFHTIKIIWDLKKYICPTTLLVLIKGVHDSGKKCINVMEKYKVSIHSQNSASLGHSNFSFSKGACWKCRVLQPSIPRGWFCRAGSVNKCYGRQNMGAMDLGQEDQGTLPGHNDSGVMVHVWMFGIRLYAMEVIIMK